MKIPREPVQTLILTALLLLGAAAANGQKAVDHATVALETLGETSSQVRLKLVDGSSIAADEAWEGEQGVWYRRGGMSHLVPRDRVKAIERGVEMPQEEGLFLEATLFGLACATEDMREGTKAFLEKRPPQFRGK